MKPQVDRISTHILFYASVITGLFKNNFLSQLQYRVSIGARFLAAFLELFIIIAFFKILYSKISNINGWNYTDILILVCIFDFSKNMLLGFFIKNLPKLEDLLVKGKLDVILTKPIDPQFYISFQQISFGHISQLLVPIAILIYLFFTTTQNVSFISLCLLPFMIMMGLLIGYSLWIIIMSFTFYVVKIKSLHEIFLNLLQLGKYPSSIYSPAIKFILCYLFPILMIASFPIEIFLGYSHKYKIFYMLIVTVVLVYVSRIFWKISLKNYESSGG